MEALQDFFNTTDDIYALPDGTRAELIDGQIYDMAPPNTMHQRISYALARKISEYIDNKDGSCEVFPAPFAVFLNKDNRNYLEPDISVICDKDKIDERGCNGAPDWVIEVISPSTAHMDYGIKLYKYRSCSVREYWIVNPMHRTINVYDFEHDEKTWQYTFDEEILSCIYDDLRIRVADLVHD